MATRCPKAGSASWSIRLPKTGGRYAGAAVALLLLRGHASRVTTVPPELWPIVCRLATSRPWPPQGDADVAAFFDYAQREKLLALLMADNDLPDQVIRGKSRFRALVALYRRRYELSRDVVLEVLRVLGPEAFLFYKGTDYRHRLYAHPEQRAMNDIDIYLPWVSFRPP